MDDEMDERTRREVASGHPVVVVHFDKDHSIIREERYNMENVHLDTWRLEQLARAFYPDIVAFFETPEGQREFEKWQAEQEKKHSQQGKK